MTYFTFILLILNGIFTPSVSLYSRGATEPPRPNINPVTGPPSEIIYPSAFAGRGRAGLHGPSRGGVR